jgi:hypothetical protein
LISAPRLQKTRTGTPIAPNRTRRSVRIRECQGGLTCALYRHPRRGPALAPRLPPLYFPRPCCDSHPTEASVASTLEEPMSAMEPEVEVRLKKLEFEKKFGKKPPQEREITVQPSHHTNPQPQPQPQPQPWGVEFFCMLRIPVSSRTFLPFLSLYDTPRLVPFSARRARSIGRWGYGSRRALRRQPPRTPERTRRAHSQPSSFGRFESCAVKCLDIHAVVTTIMLRAITSRAARVVSLPPRASPPHPCRILGPEALTRHRRCVLCLCEELLPPSPVR